MAVLKQIINTFSDLTDINVNYYNIEGESIASSDKSMCSFCACIRKFPDIYGACIRCDREAFKAAGEKKGLHLYQCHMNLWEAAIPIFINENPVGFMMLGQIRGMGPNSESDKESTLRKLEDRLSKEELEYIGQEYDKIHSMEIKKIEAAAKMLEIIANYIADTEVIRIAVMEAVEKAKNYIDSNLEASLSTSKVAKVIGHNASYLSALFKRETGMTITEYIEKQRLVIAKQHLVLSSKTIREIASEVGYVDQNYFSRVFKKHVGMSPMEYRMKNQKLC